MGKGNAVSLLISKRMEQSANSANGWKEKSLDKADGDSSSKPMDAFAATRTAPWTLATSSPHRMEFFMDQSWC